MRGGWPSFSLLVTVALLLAVLGGGALWWHRRRGPAPPSPPPRTAATPGRADGGGAAGLAPRGGAEREGDADGAGAEGGGGPVDPLAEIGVAPRGPWAKVDLNAVRSAMPDNLYWTMSAPTKDPTVLEWREQERARWNVEYGKVLSSTATPEEIDAYYAYRQRISEDYIEFATHLLAYYGDALPKRDLGLLKLAVDMHLARLEEIPREITDAHERRKVHEAERRAWLEQQKAFDGDGPREP